MRVNLIGKVQIENFITRRRSQFVTAGGAKPKSGKPKKLKRKISNATVNRELPMPEEDVQQPRRGRRAYIEPGQIRGFSN
jgi:hypothetical protein